MHQDIQIGVSAMSDILILLSETITTDTYGNEVVTEQGKQIYCDVDSISQSEFFAAADTELNPQYKFTVFFGDYNGEDTVKYNGTRYAIYRTYRTGDDLELYAERKIGA